MNEKVQRTWFWLPVTQHNSLRQTLKDLVVLGVLALLLYLAPDARSWSLAFFVLSGYVFMDVGVRYFDVYDSWQADLGLRVFFSLMVLVVGTVVGLLVQVHVLGLYSALIVGGWLSLLNELPWERWLLAFGSGLPGAVGWLLVLIWGLIRSLIGGLFAILGGIWELIQILRGMRVS